ncbi:MAG: pyruvate, phosphate dikinase/phosphoenolpyruvate synthase regulator [Desulfarculaceae bacterium]|jgi:regulator of PEP synthase PpsR (kinase-PPPase family)
MAKPRKKVAVYVISDATGITAERVIKAVLLQFGREIEPVVECHAFVKSTRQLRRILDKAEVVKGLVIYSLVSERLRKWLARERQRRNLEMIDLLGPLLTRMQKLFNVIPTLHPGLLGILGEESISLARAIDFTLKHDDGAGLETLGRADMIIMGVSRTAKTSTSLFLSCNNNLKVANVPIVLGVDPPKKVFSLKRPRKVGFSIKPDKLAEIRRRRYRGRLIPGYNDMQTIVQEVAFSQEVFDQVGDIQILDVTNTSIEEVANRIT